MNEFDYMDDLADAIWFEKQMLKEYVVSEAKANNMWDIFKDLNEEQWMFMINILYKFNRKMK